MPSSPPVLKINRLWFSNEVTGRTLCFLVRRVGRAEERLSGSHCASRQGGTGCRAASRAREMEIREHPEPRFHRGFVAMWTGDKK